MKISQLRQIIRECIEEVMIDEAREGGGVVKKGNASGFRKNRVYGRPDRLKRRETLTKSKASPIRDKQKFIKGSMTLDKAYPSSEESVYYLDQQGKERSLGPKARKQHRRGGFKAVDQAAKKSGVGK